MGFAQNYQRLVILYIVTLIIIFLLLWIGFYEYLGLDGMNVVLDAIIFFPLLFGIVTMYYKHDKRLKLDDDGIREFIGYDLIFTSIGLVTGLVFIILYLILR